MAEVSAQEFTLGFNFVCFIDILGFSHMVRSDCESPSGTQNFIEKLYRVHANAMQLTKSEPGLQLFQFSDSIVISSPYVDVNFPKFTNIISKYQYDLFKEHILCRGGVAYGKHFSRETFIFSNGLIEAYNLERNAAKCPRIVISWDLIDLLYPGRVFPPDLPVIKEDDGMLFIDFLRNGCAADCQPYLKEIEISESSTPSQLMEKHHWLLSYFNFKFPKEAGLTVPRFSSCSTSV